MNHSSRDEIFIDAVVHAYTWVVWKGRYEEIFKGIVFNPLRASNYIQSLVYSWVCNMSDFGKNIYWYNWCCNPRSLWSLFSRASVSLVPARLINLLFKKNIVYKNIEYLTSFMSRVFGSSTQLVSIVNWVEPNRIKCWWSFHHVELKNKNCRQY